MACGPVGDDNVWLCDGAACNKGGIHTTCKKAKEAEGYIFQYTERALLMYSEHMRQRAIRLGETDDSSNP